MPNLSATHSPVVDVALRVDLDLFLRKTVLDMTGSDLFTAVNAGAATLAAMFAGVQIWYSRRDANNRIVFDHLREIDSRIQQAWSVPTEVARDEILEFYQRKRKDLTPGGKAYLALLNSLDLLAFAVQKDLVKSRPIDEYVKTLVSNNVLSLTFLKELRKCCGDDASYEHLYEYFTKLRATEREKKMKES